MSQLPSERPGHAAPEELQALRARLAEALAGVEPGACEMREIGGIRTLCFGDPAARTVMLHFHGGGFRQGQPEMIGCYAAALAQRCGIEVWCPAYRLAPEFPFPAALHDGLHLLGAAATRRLILAGDSAGGGLAATLAGMSSREHRVVAGVVLHSPWLDLRVLDGCYGRNAATDPLFSEAAARAAATLYLQAHPADDPLASPILADVAQFPPALISVGTGEVLFGDSLAFHRKLVEAERPVDLLVVNGMDHVAVTRGLHQSGAAEVFERTVSFVEQLR